MELDVWNVKGAIDRYATQCIKHHGKLIVDRNILEDKIVKKADELNLLKKVSVDPSTINKKRKKANFIYKSIIFVVAFILLMAILNGVPNLDSLFWYIIGIAILILHFCYAYFDSYNKRYRFLSRKLSYARSEKGEELNEKIEGLKNFTKDYTLLDERTLEEITLWEDYLVYSVLWGQNEKEIKKYKQYVGFDEKVWWHHKVLKGGGIINETI